MRQVWDSGEGLPDMRDGGWGKTTGAGPERVSRTEGLEDRVRRRETLRC